MNTPGSKVQIGCGAGPLPGWINIDNSPSVRIARLPRASGLVESLGGALGLIGPANRAVIAAARAHGVLWGDARHLPLPDNCAAVVYSAHMLEHLPDRPLGQGGARDALAEMYRILVPGGWLRLVLPNFHIHAQAYLSGQQDLDRTLARLDLATPVAEGAAACIKAWLSGPRHHLHAYDPDSLARRLRDTGFGEVTTLTAGDTGIESLRHDPDLDLAHRSEESLYVEARKP